MYNNFKIMHFNECSEFIPRIANHGTSAQKFESGEISGWSASTKYDIQKVSKHMSWPPFQLIIIQCQKSLQFYIVMTNRNFITYSFISFVFSNSLQMTVNFLYISIYPYQIVHRICSKRMLTISLKLDRKQIFQRKQWRNLQWRRPYCQIHSIV